MFNGGTSLSKVGAIRRFSEDIDLTYDIRRLAPDLVGETGDAHPATRGEERRWSKAIRARLPAWVTDEVLPLIERQLAEDELPARAVAEKDKICIEYQALASGSGYVAPRVMLEFGDAPPFVKSVVFPAARPRVMRAERTFCEKATAVHVFCSEGPLRGDRFARHWHDLARLDEAGLADRAIADRAIADAVAAHKSWFFAEKESDRQPIDYRAAVAGGLKLVPKGASREALAEDYAQMVDDGLLLDEAEPFEDLMRRIEDLETRANAAAGENAD